MNSISTLKHKAQQTGFTLIELMITITIGSFIIIGATVAFQSAQNTYTTNDNVARLFGQAQYALDILEEDLRLNSFWGLHNRRRAVEGDSNDPNIPAAATIAGDCDEAWSLDLRFGISGSNGKAASPYPTWADASGCIAGLSEPVAAQFVAGTDTLVIRHAEYTPEPVPDAGRVYIRSDDALPLSKIFLGGTTVPNVGLNSQNFAYLAHGYYITPDSYEVGDDIPMLRRMALTLNDATNKAEVQSQELASGVEDLQIQFGVDYDLKGKPGYGGIDQYVNPDNGALQLLTTRVLSVRLWLLIRGDQAEPGYESEAVYNYANMTVNHPNDGFRRLLVSKTIQIRNMDVTK